MGSNRDHNGPPPDGDGWSPDPASDLPDLPELPAGVRIPDDPADLAVLAEQVRAELRAGPGSRPVPPDGQPLAPPDGQPLARANGPSPRLLAAIMCVAVMITVVSLLAMALSRPAPPPAPAEPPASLPAMTLTDAAGRSTEVAALAPAVIIFVERCGCGDLVARTLAEAPAGVTVAVVGGTPAPAAPPGSTAPDGAVRLVDPEGALRQALELGAPPADAATVVLADAAGVIQQVSPAASSLEPYRDVLAGLG